MKTSGVYAIKNGLKLYIGFSKDIQKRIRSHESALKANKHKNMFLQNDYNENNKNFEYIILEETEDKKREGEIMNVMFKEGR
ncbi:MAG: GIY-YIG nuclease family protein, partial [Sarcina sp.]